jgi:hypothetical protein
MLRLSQIPKIPIFRSLLILLLAVISIELAGMWHEVSGLRHEQVKNAVYSARPKLLESIKATKNVELREWRLRQLESTVKIDDSFSLAVKVDEPLAVTVDGTVPVEIER